MNKYTTKIKFKEGFHSRPAMKLTNLAREYENSDIKITKINNDIQNINCNSLIAILKANIQFNDTIEISFKENAHLALLINEIFD